MGFNIIAIDGPSGVGKSSISRNIAKKIGFFYVDTGAMFRCLAWNSEEQGCPENSDLLLTLCNQTEIFFKKDNVICNGKNVTQLIRSEHISKLASKISVYPSIRILMKKKQRELVENLRNSKDYYGAVLEGRDIGTVVFPRADFKFFLDAMPEVRAKRRRLQLMEKGEDIKFEEILKSLKSRDYRDKNRKIAPLKPAKDAIIINTDSMTESQVLDNLLSYVL